MREQRRLVVAFGMISAWLMGFVPLAFSAATYDLGEMKQAKALYYRAVSGDEKARKQSAAAFDRLASRNPDDAEVMAYRGSLTLLEAGKTWAVWRKYELSKQGIVLLDRAVERAPDNLEVRFVRAATTRKLPQFFDRAEQSKDDLGFLAERISGAGKGQLDPALAAAALYFYAEDVATGQRRIEALQLSIEIAPQSQAGQDAAKALAASRM